MFDTHCHLTFDCFEGRIPVVEFHQQRVHFNGLFEDVAMYMTSEETSLVLPRRLCCCRLTGCSDQPGAKLRCERMNNGIPNTRTK